MAAAVMLVQGVGLAAMVAPSASAADWHDLTTLTADAQATWQTNGIAWTVESAGGVVYVGGTFTSVRPPGAAPGVGEVPRNNLAAFDAATGALLPCAPSILLGTSDGTVRALKASPDGKRLYVGGSFSRVDGVGVANLVSIDTSSCTLTAAADFRRPAVAATVRAIDVTPSTVYVGGDFTTVDNVSRPRFAAVTTAGALTSATATFDLPVRAITAAPEVGKIIVGGDFTSTNGDTNTSKLVALDPTTGAVVQSFPGWLPTGSVVKDLVRDGTNFYLAAESSIPYGFEGRLVAVLATGALVWKDTCRGATQTVAVYQGVLYSGSHAHDCSTTPGGFPEGKRHHLLAESVTDKTILPWFPDTNGGLGEALGPRAMVMAGNQMYVVGEFTTVNGVPQQGITRFAPSPDTGYVDPPTLSVASKEVGRVLVSWTAGFDLDDDAVTYQLFRSDKTDPIYTTTVSSREWSRPRLSFMDTVTPGTTVSYRIRTSDGTNVSPKGAAASITAATGPWDPYSAAVFEDGPTLNWRFNEVGGTVAADDSGNGRTGIYYNTALQDPGALGPRLGTSARFYGQSWVYPSSATPRRASDTLSVELWFRTDTTRGGRLIGFGDNRLGISHSYDRNLYLTNAGNLVYGGGGPVIESPGTYRDNQWHYAVGTTGANGTRLYVDGALVGQNGTTIDASYDGFWKVGGGDTLLNWPDAPSSYNFSGNIDEVAVYDQALSPARVFAHYLAARGTVTDTQAPTAPTGLTATASSSTVSLSWTAASDNLAVTRYQIHRSSVPNFTPSAATLVGTSETTSAVDTAPTGTWYYRVVAVDGVGNASAGSNPVSVTAADTQAPSVPANVTTSVSGSDVAVSWNAATDDTGVTGYNVYRLASAGDPPSPSTLVGSAPTAAFTDSGVPTGSWTYKVVAFDAAGNRSDASAAASAVVLPPAPVTRTVTASADTYVNAGAKTTNYGKGTSAIVDGSPVQQMLVRFALPAAPAGQQLTSAVLRVRTSTQALASAANPLEVHLADDGWDESTVTYSTKPNVGAVSLGAVASVDVNASYDIPLDAAALRALTGGNASLAIVMAGDDNAQLLTRETGSAASRPQLILTFS